MYERVLCHFSFSRISQGVRVRSLTILSARSRSGYLVPLPYSLSLSLSSLFPPCTSSRIRSTSWRPRLRYTVGLNLSGYENLARKHPSDPIVCRQNTPFLPLHFLLITYYFQPLPPPFISFQLSPSRAFLRIHRQAQFFRSTFITIFSSRNAQTRSTQARNAREVTSK